jgi:hypothetical protein
MDDMLSTSFLLPVEKAKHLVFIAVISKDTIPQNTSKPEKAATVAPFKGDDELKFSLQNKLTTSIKQLVLTLSGFKNQFK